MILGFDLFHSDLNAVQRVCRPDPRWTNKWAPTYCDVATCPDFAGADCANCACCIAGIAGNIDGRDETIEDCNFDKMCAAALGPGERGKRPQLLLTS